MILHCIREALQVSHYGIWKGAEEAAVLCMLCVVQWRGIVLRVKPAPATSRQSITKQAAQDLQQQQQHKHKSSLLGLSAFECMGCAPWAAPEPLTGLAQDSPAEYGGVAGGDDCQSFKPQASPVHLVTASGPSASTSPGTVCMAIRSCLEGRQQAWFPRATCIHPTPLCRALAIPARCLSLTGKWMPWLLAFMASCTS